MHANGHKGAKWHPAIDCPKHLAHVVAIRPFQRGRLVGLQEAEWMYRRISAHVGHNVSVVCSCFQQWSLELSHTLRPGSGWPCTVVQMHIKIDALCEQQWLLPGKKSRHMLHLLCHQGPLGTICLQQDSDHMCFWPGNHLYHDTAKNGYSGVVKVLTGACNDALLSSVLRVGSVCMRVMNVHVYGVDL